MNDKEKLKIQTQIGVLNNVKENLLKLNQNNPKIIAQINEIQEQIDDNYLELENASQYIPLRKKFYNTFLKSKIVVLNFLLLVFEVLNQFTDIFNSNEKTKWVSIAIPVLTIFLRTYNQEKK